MHPVERESESTQRSKANYRALYSDDQIGFTANGTLQMDKPLQRSSKGYAAKATFEPLLG